MVYTNGEPLNGKWTSSSDVDFCVDKKMVHIGEYKSYKHYGDYFIRQLTKLHTTEKKEEKK